MNHPIQKTSVLIDLLRLVTRANRVGRYAALLALLVVSTAMPGCSLFRSGRFSPASKQLSPPSAPEAQQFTGGDTTEPITPAELPESTKRSEQAREQVLAFINRVESIQQTNQSADTTAKSVPAVQATGSAIGHPTPAPANVPVAVRPNQAISTLPVSQDADRTADEGAPAGMVATSSNSVANETTPSPPRIVDVSIRHPVDTGATLSAKADESTTDDHVANRPLGDDHVDRQPSHVDRIFHDLEQRVTDAPNDVDARWRLGLLALATGRPQSVNVSDVAEMSERSATLLQHSMRVVEAVGRALGDPNNDVEGAVDAIESLHAVLKERADLEIPSVALCSRVQAFGVYDELGDAAFVPQAVNQAIVYFEIKNFTSQPTDDGRFRSLIADSFEVLNPEGDVLWKQEEPSIEDLSRSRRGDFFVAQRIALPATFAAGEYVLKITVEDRLASKRTQAIHPFHIGPREATVAR